MDSILDKYGVPSPVRKPISEPKTQYKFSCVFSDFDIFMHINDVELLFNADTCVATISMRNPKERKMLKELTEYSKLKNENSVLTVTYLGGSSTDIPLETIVIKSFEISNISTKLDYSKAEPCVIVFECKGKFEVQ